MLETVLAGGVWMGVVMGFGLVGLGVSLWSLVGGRRSRLSGAIGWFVATMLVGLSGSLLGITNGLMTSTWGSAQWGSAIGMSLTPLAVACCMTALGCALLGTVRLRAR